MEELLKTDEIRIVEVVAPDYEGFGPDGLIEDLKLGLGALIQHHSAFKRIAVVSDMHWVAHAQPLRLDGPRRARADQGVGRRLTPWLGQRQPAGGLSGWPLRDCRGVLC